MSTDTLRQITGTFRAPDGSVYANQTLTWFRERREVQPQGTSTVLDQPFYEVTDGAGTVDFEVMAGRYLVMVQLQDADRYFHVSVPDEAGPFDISSLIDAPASSEPDDLTEFQALVNKAKAWASAAPNVEVERGQYSARHYSTSANASQVGAGLERSAAAVSASEAQASASAALAASNSFASSAAGIAATSDGDVFLVATSDPQIFEVYQNDGGAAGSIGTMSIANGERFNSSADPLLSHDLQDSLENTVLGIRASDGGVMLAGFGPSSVQEVIGSDDADATDGILWKLTDVDGVTVGLISSNGRLFLPGLDGFSVQDRIKSIAQEVEGIQSELGSVSSETVPSPLIVDVGPEVYIGEVHASPLSQRVPGAARTGGRSWAAWYSNDDLADEGPGDYINLAYSDDEWATSTEYAIIRYGSEPTWRVFDPQLWVDPDGLLWIIFSVGGDNTKFDGVWGAWAITVKNPEAEFPSFSTPFRISYYGVPMLPTRINEQVYLPIDYWRTPTPDYPALAGKRLFELLPKSRGAVEVSTLPESVQSASFDETYIVQLSTGRLMAAFRTGGTVERCFSEDNGLTWTAPETWAALGTNTSSRIWMGYSPTGRLVVCYNNAGGRTNLQLKLSEDDGETFAHSIQLSNVSDVSYPSVYFDDAGNISVVFDQNRTTDKRINVAIVNEAELVAGTATVTSRIISDK